MKTCALGFARAMAVALLMMVTLGCAAAPESLAGTEWRLVGWSVSSLYPGDFEITAVFHGGRIEGKAGVNSYGGGYTLGPGDAFAVGDLVTTLMAGPEPAMWAEQAYLELLTQVRTCALADNTLTLYDEAGNEILVFRPVDR